MELRKLRFDGLTDAAAEAEQLLVTGYTSQGNWTLGQCCRHLRLVQDPSIDGYPSWMRFFAFLRPIMRRVLLPKALSPDPPTGIKTLGNFEPGSVDEDSNEVAMFRKSVERFLDHKGDLHPHPAFGRMDHSQLETLHAAHAAHHLRFLQPRKSTEKKELAGEA